MVDSRSVSTCRACGRGPLEPHLRVAGEAGPDGLIPTTDRYGTALADIVRCAYCGHGQLEPMPAAAVLDSAYAEAASEDYLREEAGQRATARRMLDRIERHAPRPGVPGTSVPLQLLDLGCWVGFLLAEAAERGWEAVGVEPSAWASALARDRLGLDVRTGDLFAADLEPQSFDAVVMADVIEHLPDPGAALDRVHEWLAPGGVLALALPDAGSPLARALGAKWWSVLPTHVQYFTRGSLEILLSRHGFHVLEARTAPKAFTVRYYLERLGGYSPPLARLLVAAAERAGVADRLVTPDFGDRMWLLARATT
jgi:SAM-dependent methyltransferase